MPSSVADDTLTDTRGARGRARAVRDAARDGADVQEAVLVVPTTLGAEGEGRPDRNRSCHIAPAGQRPS